jgi:hypothetical protein
MASLTFILNGQPYTTLITPVGLLTAFSGTGPHRNNPESVGVPDGGPIPGGGYYIVDRQSGGWLGKVKNLALSRDQWFALWRDDGSVDDFTLVNNVQRGLFRLHPLGPRGNSTGCVVLQSHTEFARLRASLLQVPWATVPGTSIRSYGLLSVGALAPDGPLPRPARPRHAVPGRAAV